MITQSSLTSELQNYSWFRDRQLLTDLTSAIFQGPTSTPEQFGAVGNGVADDTTAITNMANAGRTAGYLNVVLTAGKTYTCSNPFIFSGINVLIIEGNGANWINNRSTPVTGFYINYSALAFTNPFEPWGYQPYDTGGGSISYGQLISTVSAMSSTVTVQSGNCPVGPVLIYGFNRLSIAGFPPCPSHFEYNNVVSAVGAVGTLATSTRYNYDSRWPSYSGAGGDGPPYIISLNTAGANWMSFINIRNVNFLENPAFSPTLNAGTNGAVQFAFADTILVENCSMSTSDPTCCRNITYDNCHFYDTTQGIQPDKLIDNLLFRRCRFDGGIAGALGIKSVVLEDCIGLVQNAISPIENLNIIRGYWIGKDASSSTAMFGDNNSGTARIRIEKPTIVPLSSSIDRVMQIHLLSAAFSIISTSGTSTTIGLSRSAYNTSSINLSIRLGSILRDVNGIPAFRVQVLPYTTGDPVTGDVWIDGDNLSNFSNGATLYLHTCSNVEYIDPIYKGPYLNLPTSLYGTGYETSPFPSNKVRDSYNKDNCICIDSRMSYNSVARASNLFRHMTGMFSISEIVINVTSSAISGGSVSLQLEYEDPSGNVNQLFQAIDLLTVGRRIIDHNGITTLGADNSSSSGLGATVAAAIYWRDAGASLVQPNQPVWSITFYGNYVNMN